MNCRFATSLSVLELVIRLFRTLRVVQRAELRLRMPCFVDDGNIELTNNRRECELRRLVQGRKNWMFTWKDIGAERSAAILSIVATCISYDLNPRAYLHVVTKLILDGWPQSKLRDLLPDRIVARNPELYVAIGTVDDPPAVFAAKSLKASRSKLQAHRQPGFRRPW